MGLFGRYRHSGVSKALAAAAFISLVPNTHAAFPVIGYWANWGGDISGIQFQYMTHLLYSFAGVDASGNISVNDAQVKQLVTLGHAKGTKIGLAMGGGGGDKGFQTIINSTAAIDLFVKNAAAICDKYDLDGLDMDWEYPNSAQAVNFESMMKKLGDAMHAKDRFMSIAVIGGDPSRGKDIHNGVFDAVDFVNIMAYDNGGANHSPYDLAVLCYDYWLNQHKCPKAKAILGLPFYGYDPSGKYMGYRDIVARDATAPQKDFSNNFGYNGIPTIQKKTQLAYDRGGGVMIWEISMDVHDGNSLLKAINDKSKAFNVSVRESVHNGNENPLLAVSPNRITFRAPAAGQYLLRIQSLSGGRVSESRVSAQASGETVLDWSTPGLASGAYAATLEGKGISASRPFVLR
ncbi:MAG: hypothetical protein JWO30_4372 [Fibrobacteres bacterium]|nr:hypothetical protein [Fibrobacterota bacterium]